MSRAFVRESDQEAAESLPERPISPHPNFVTPRGLRRIEEQIRALEAERQAARDVDDTAALARMSRDLHYWVQRRASARVVELPVDPDVVRFGVRVTLLLQDGTQRQFQLVGEDEADPPRGLLSWVSPLAESLLGKSVGDIIEFQGRDAEIVRLDGGAGH